jgi:hypothetical protein
MGFCSFADGKSYLRCGHAVLPWGNAYQPTGYQSGGIQIVQGVSACLKLQDIIEALPPEALKGLFVLSAVESTLMPAVQAPRDPAREESASQGRRDI